MSYNPPMKEQILHYFRNLYYEDKREYEKLSSGLDKLIEETKRGKWIPCNEKLPDNDFYCIVTLEYPVGKIGVYTGWFDRVGCCWFVGSQLFRTNNVLAWQPFPEPYRKE